MNVQFYWLNPADATDKIFVAQNDVADATEATSWMLNVLETEKGSCPENWQPMVVNEESPAYVHSKT